MTSWRIAVMIVQHVRLLQKVLFNGRWKVIAAVRKCFWSEWFFFVTLRILHDFFLCRFAAGERETETFQKEIIGFEQMANPQQLILHMLCQHSSVIGVQELHHHLPHPKARFEVICRGTVTMVGPVMCMAALRPTLVESPGDLDCRVSFPDKPSGSREVTAYSLPPIAPGEAGTSEAGCGEGVTRGDMWVEGGRWQERLGAGIKQTDKKQLRHVCEDELHDDGLNPDLHEGRCTVKPRRLDVF
ncbi:hypothetical protein F7725_011123 [Dissostichus mawsoni]|uniref:Uncharacterized protein n=1 Tax=Dissostichus mawsoni TaxID=36200 RepID=A0A7J5Z7X8_DISMA|nr:hypothetical protein F7725_011123 [Dissostichus mawsoni]